MPKSATNHKQHTITCISSVAGIPFCKVTGRELNPPKHTQSEPRSVESIRSLDELLASSPPSKPCTTPGCRIKGPHEHRQQSRSLTEAEGHEIVNLYHLARTALSGPGTSPSKHARMIWASSEFAKLHPEVSSTAAYKALDRLVG